MTNDGLLNDNARREGHGHLSDERLNRYLDSDLTPDELRAADLHLAGCDLCTAQLNDLRAVSLVLRALPQMRAPRSFQLDPSYSRSTGSFWHRFGAALLPALPALRAGTIAVALAFASVTAYRVVDDGPQSGSRSGDNAMIAQPATVPAESTNTAVDAGRAAEAEAIATEIPVSGQPSDADEPGADGPAASDTFIADDESSGAASELAPPGGEEADLESSDESMEMFEAQDADEADGASPGSDSANLEIAQSAPVDASPTAVPFATATATAFPTATSTATVLPTPLPTELPAPVAEDGSDDSSWLGWAQLVLGVMLALLGGLVVGVHRLRKKVAG